MMSFNIYINESKTGIFTRRNTIPRWNELSGHEKTGRDMKLLLLSKRSWFEKSAYFFIPIVWWSGKDKTMETIKRSLVMSSWGKRRRNKWNMFRTLELFCAISGWCIYIITHLSRPIKCHNTKTGPSCKRQISVNNISIGSRRFTNVQSNARWQNQGRWGLGGRGNMWKI